jgi:hypothetical protein
MAQHRILTTDEEIEKATTESGPARSEPRLMDVRSVRSDGEASVLFSMDDGSKHYIPKSSIEGLATASDQAINNFEISEDGLGVSWPELDLDLFVPPLLQGIYGTTRWMGELGRCGGRVRSHAKTAAARENGRKGGRPPKVVCLPCNPPQPDMDDQTQPEGARRPRTPAPPKNSGTGTLLHSREKFGLIYGFAAGTSPRELPRIA